MDFPVNRSVLTLQEGDITKVPADAIVNAANSRLAGGGGVDGAIHRAGGPSIMAELDEIRKSKPRCPAGDAVVTRAGNLPAQYVIHAVGPIYEDGKNREEETLASCYRTALRLAAERGARTVSFPSISTGAYGYPLAKAAETALRTVADYLRAPNCPMEKVTFVLFGQAAFDTYRETAKRLLGA
jgi:O-acetyl-ADP-ribose deacetylase (regulator of RNase III)